MTTGTLILLIVAIIVGLVLLTLLIAKLIDKFVKVSDDYDVQAYRQNVQHFVFLDTFYNQYFNNDSNNTILK